MHVHYVCAVICRPPFSEATFFAIPTLFFFFFCFARAGTDIPHSSTKASAHLQNMADTATTNDADAAAQRAAEQARLRKERREAKIKAGGSARLERITGVGGRVTGGAY